jgi:hypothetical protein
MIAFMRRRILLLLGLALVLAACGPGRLPEQVLVNLTSDGETRALLLPQGSTVRDALRDASVTLAELDRVRPPETSQLLSGMGITVTRVIQTTEIVTKTKPYQPGPTITDYSLKPGESQIAQAGRNGEITMRYRLTYEDGQLISRVEVAQDETATPVPEIIRKGPSEDFKQIVMPGTLVYMSNNNAYVIRDIMDNWHALTADGDLDGHVFSLSANGRWLLYTRANTSTVNSLWLVDTLAVPEPQTLKIDGVLWADFAPDGKSIAYSRAEPAPGVPEWKALNDLTIVPFDNGKLGKPKQILKPSAAAPYAWWGTNFSWSPDSKLLAYANAAEIGVISPTAKITRTLPITYFTAYNTRWNYAWVPALSWSPDGQFLVSQIHSPSGDSAADEDSPAFDIVALQVSGTLQTPLIAVAGMWATPRWLGTAPGNSQIVFGKAETPDASMTSRYSLNLMDRDGSNQRPIYPENGQLGLRGLVDFAVAPDGRSVLVVNQGDLYRVDLTGKPQQLTADGSISLPRWAK